MRGQGASAFVLLTGTLRSTACADGAACTDIAKMKAKAVRIAIRRLNPERITEVS